MKSLMLIALLVVLSCGKENQSPNGEVRGPLTPPSSDGSSSMNTSNPPPNHNNVPIITAVKCKHTCSKRHKHCR